MKPWQQRVLLTGGATYTKKVQGVANLIAYWPLAESSAASVLDASGNGLNGTYTSVTLGVAGIGDGRSAASFDGTASRCNVFSSSLASAVNTSEGTVIAWGQVANSGVWGDGNIRYLFELNVDNNNRISILKNGASTLTLAYRGAATLKQVTTGAQSATTFFHLALTWSISGDAVKAYLNGAQTGSTQTSLVAFSGTPVVAIVGAQTTTPIAVHSGALAHVALFTRALSGAEIATLATA